MCYVADAKNVCPVCMTGENLKTVKSVYENCTACVRVGVEMSGWFPVNVGLRLGRVMPVENK